WPRRDSGPVAGAPGETWSGINTALQCGLRGLPGGCSLADLLATERGHRNRKNLPPLRPRQILAWADAHRQRTGRWPTHESGPIPEAPGEPWLAVDSALGKGLRGLPGGDPLARLLGRDRGCAPAATPLARLQAREGQPVTNLRHELVTLGDF